MILAVDTSTDQASVALAGEHGIRAELSWTARGNHSRQLTGAIAELLALDATGIGDVTGLAVAIGPGSFSGVRVGLSEVKGIALGRRLPVAGVSTLDVVAFQASCGSPDVWAILPAGRRQVYLAHYLGQGESWRRANEYAIAGVGDAARTVGESSLLAGEGAEDVARVLRERGVEPKTEPPGWRLRRAGFLAELGKRCLDVGRHTSLDQLEPLYLRASAAEEKRAGGRQE